MKKKLISVIMVLFMVMLVCGTVGCRKKGGDNPPVTLEKVVSDLHSPLVKSTNLDVVLPGIYVLEDTVFHYYSVDKLDNMSFDERVELLDFIDTNSSNVNIVMGNKLKKFNNYISIDDTLKNGVIATSIIGLYVEVFNEELGVYLYSNGNKLKTISVTTKPNKLEYILGEKLDLTGLVISGLNMDGTLDVQTYTQDDVSGFDSTTIGTKTITITIYGRTCSFDITVTDSIISSSFTFIRNIDLLKLKQYYLNVTVANSNITKLVMSTDTGGISPSVITLTSLSIVNKSITMDVTVTKVTIRVFDTNGNQIGHDKVITL